MTNIRHFWVASNSREPMQTIKTMWKAIFQKKLTIYKANLPSFVQKIIKSRCCVDLSCRPRLKCHPKMAAWERLIVNIFTSVQRVHLFNNYVMTTFLVCEPRSREPRRKAIGSRFMRTRLLGQEEICDVIIELMYLKCFKCRISGMVMSL
jgi:hypothetical protein